MLDFVLFFIENFMIAWVIIPVVLVVKAILFARIDDEKITSWVDFVYYGHSNIATTHHHGVKSKKKLQNQLSVAVLVLIIIQLMLAIPVIIKG